MERISDKNIELKLEGTFTSAVVDKAGDRIAEEAIRDIKNQIESDPDKQKFTVDHSGRVVGEILDIWTNVNEEDIFELKGTVGIYEGNDDVIERIESDELSGFSIEAHYFQNTNQKEWSNSDQKLELRVDGEQRGELHSKFDSYDLKFKTDLEKSATGIAVFTILVENILPISISIVILHEHFFSNEEDGKGKGQPEKVELPNGKEINMNQNIEDILRDVENSMGEEIDIDYESLSSEEILKQLKEL